MRGDILWLALEETTSTNAIVREEVMAGRAKEAVCWAKRQTQGRGRLGRIWQSPEGGLYFSWAVPVGGWPPVWLQPLAGLAVLDVWREHSGPAQAWAQPAAEVGLKWPNDIIVRVRGAERSQERKLGGILSEYLTQSIGGPHAIVGIGLNLNTEIHLPEEDTAKRALPPISWKQITGKDHSPEEIAQALYEALRRRLDAMGASGEHASATLREAWAAACWTLGSEVRVLRPDGGQIEGCAVDLAEDLSLVIEDTHGQRHTLTAGDCLHLRPTS
ncbi:biotin--[acetyl-CoA-carboxylase] ligase [Myxococcota bacterium]|nr:biotin--[acetyl-CoA-carboxylase] ligase [Myxococcota bacterium]